MHFESTVETNALLLSDPLEGSRLPVGVSTVTQVLELDVRSRCGWVHPRADVRATVPTNLIRAVLHARKLMLPSGSLLRVVSVPELCAQVAPVAYVLQPRDVEAEIESRGPVMSTLPVTLALLAYWSALLKGETLPPFDGTFANLRHGTSVQGSVAVVILGFTPDTFVIGLPWGATCDTEDAWGYNGCIRVAKQLALLSTNVVAMCDSLPVKTDNGGEILVLPLTPVVLQHAALQNGKLPKKTEPVVVKAAKPKVKVKASLNAGPPPSKLTAFPGMVNGANGGVSGKGSGGANGAGRIGGGGKEDVRDKAMFITLGILCVVVMVLMSIFLAKKKVKRAPKSWNK